MPAVRLIGIGDGATAAFFLASRLPDLWRGVLAIEGTPKPAIDSNRFFAGTTRGWCRSGG